MARGINKVILLGNVGKEPEVKATKDGKQMASFSIATGESWKDKTTGEKKETTEWHRITLYGALAEICQKYVHKGSKIYLEGSLRTNKWTDTNKQVHYTTQIVGSELQMLDEKNEKPVQQYIALSMSDPSPNDDLPF